MSEEGIAGSAKLSSWWRALEGALSFAPLSLLLLFAPACYAVIQANAFADALYGTVSKTFEPLLAWLHLLPAPLAATLGGDYGVFAMLPFLLLYALPTIITFTVLIEIYKTTGLIDRLSSALYPWLRPFGLAGRDLVRVVMGFGCNVPAVVATRSCSSCSRGTCISAISFGSACSYQLPATLAVFAASGFLWLGPIYLIVLALTTLIYVRLTTPKPLRIAQSKLPRPGLGVGQEPELGTLRWPKWRVVLRESLRSLYDFICIAFPIFVCICVFAGSLQWLGVLGWVARLFAPVMAVFNLPPEAALAVVLGSVRKDGLAIGLLDGADALKVPLESSVQVLTAVYLAGVLLPCMVTALTVAREMRLSFALKMIGRQAIFAALFSICIAWLGALLLSLTQ